jgi:hypothetical protein
MLLNLESEQKFFLNYVDGFIDHQHPELCENILLKRNHSLRVSQHCINIAKAESLSDDDISLAGIIGIYHDIGRFVQYRDYHTFSDNDSVYHGLLGVSVLKELGKMNEFPKELASIIELAIYNHGLPKISDGLNDRELMFSKLIRDADKMDIYYIVDAYYKSMLKGNRNVVLELGLENKPELTGEVLQRFMDEKVILKSDMQFINDFKLLQIAWIYDLNFEYSRNYILNSGYLESIIGQISDVGKQEIIKKKVEEYFKNTVL